MKTNFFKYFLSKENSLLNILLTKFSFHKVSLYLISLLFIIVSIYINNVSAATTSAPVHKAHNSHKYKKPKPHNRKHKKSNKLSPSNNLINSSQNNVADNDIIHNIIASNSTVNILDANNNNNANKTQNSTNTQNSIDDFIASKDDIKNFNANNNPSDDKQSINMAHVPKLYSYSVYASYADTAKTIISKHPNSKMPIASITKLMTAMITLDSGADLDEYVTITASDVDTLRNTYSRLKIGAKFKRRDLLLLALMSSENRAAHALARTSFSGGLNTFIIQMNQKAQELGMTNTQFYDPTGLTVDNQSTAIDLSKMVLAAFNYKLIKQYSTTKDADIMLGRKYIHRYINSDALVRANKFPISLSKTGFINEAGHCLVLYSIINNRPIIMVFLNSAGKGGRLLDAIAIKNYINKYS